MIVLYQIVQIYLAERTFLRAVKVNNDRSANRTRSPRRHDEQQDFEQSMFLQNTIYSSTVFPPVLLTG